MARTPKPISEARANYDASAAAVRSRYEAGVRRGEWEEAAASGQAESNYQQGVQAAIASGSRARGVREAGNQSWENGAIQKGAPVIGQRMKDAAGKYEANFAPIYEAVISTVRGLPDRTLDVEANVQNRLLPVVMAAHNAGRRGGS